MFFPAEPRQLFIRIEDEKPLGEMVSLRDILASYPGGTPVYLYFEKNGKLLLTGQECWVKDNEDELYTRIKKLLGPDCLKIQQLETS